MEEAIIDAYGESEQQIVLPCMLPAHLAVPFMTEIRGTVVLVERLDLNEVDEIIAICRRGPQRQRIPFGTSRCPRSRRTGGSGLRYRHWAPLAQSSIKLAPSVHQYLSDAYSSATKRLWTRREL